MTTILGIKAEVEPMGIVLASDSQINLYDDDSQTLESKAKTRKIRIGNFWTMADEGDVDRELEKFYREVRAEEEQDATKHPIYKAVQAKQFPEVAKLNGFMRKKGVKLNDLYAFLLAVNSPQLDLWHVDEFGNLNVAPKDREIYYLSLGTGKDIAAEYIEDAIEEEKVKPATFTLLEAIDFAYQAVKKSTERDPYSGSPVDIVVVTRDRVAPYGRLLKEVISKAERQAIEDIKAKYPKTNP